MTITINEILQQSFSQQGTKSTQLAQETLTEGLFTKDGA